MASTLNRFFDFLAGKWRIPLEYENYFDFLVLLLLVGLAGFLSVFQAGTTAAALAPAAKIFAVILAFHIYALAKRGREGIAFRREVFFFLPAIFWFLADWLFISDKPWLAEINLISTTLVFGTFYVCAFHLRHGWLKWIVTGLILLLACLLSSLAWGDEQNIVQSILDRKISPVYAGLFCGLPGNPAAMGAILLLAFFPAVAVMLAQGRAFWQRLLAGYAVAVILFGIYATHHIGVWIGFLTGTVIIAMLIIEKMITRIALILAALAAFALLSPEMQRHIGVFRGTSPAQSENQPATTADALPPLATIALESFKAAPLQGVGTGGFSAAFEKHRPANSLPLPATPGSFPLTVLAEHGIIGFLLLVAPACWLWSVALKVCLSVPIRELSEKFAANFTANRKKKTLIFKKQKIISEKRIALAGPIAGTAAAAVLLCVDYPCSMPAIGVLFAINGAIMMREIDRIPVAVKTAGVRHTCLCAAVILKPACWLLWVLAPLTAASFAEKSKEELARFLPTPSNPAGGHQLESDDKPVLRAHADATEAVRLNPYNGDARLALAKSAMRLYAVQPENKEQLAGIALAAAHSACALAPHDADALVAAGTAFAMCRENEAAIEKFRAAAQIAPHSLPILISLAQALEQNAQTADEAAKIFKRILELYPENDYATKRLNFIQLGKQSEPPRE